MKYRYFLVPIVILALLLAGCGMNPAGPAMNIQAAAQQATEVKSPAGQAGETGSTGVTKANPAPGQRRENCPVTRPPNPAFTPPAPYPAPPADEFWYGTTALWTRLPDDGAWYGLPHDEHGYSQKVFWWREGYHSQSEPQPVLTVTGKRLDGSGETFQAGPATNGFEDVLQSFMLVGVEVPTTGCWQITGQYGGQELSFVVWVAP